MLKSRLKSFIKKCYLNLVPRNAKIFSFRYIKSKQLFLHLKNLHNLGFNPACILDVGAYKGEWSYYASQVFTHSKFLMIEPQPDKERFLSQMVSSNLNMQYITALVGKEEKEQALFYEMETGSSIYPEQTDVHRVVRNYKMLTLDNIVRQHNMTGEYFIKMDVQGAELDVLAGATEVLKNTNFILLEASVLNYNANAPLFADVVAYLSERNFVLFDICDESRKKDKTLLQADLIFCKRDASIRKAVNFQ